MKKRKKHSKTKTALILVRTSCICEQVGIDTDELDECTSFAREAYPYKSSDSSEVHHSDLHHGHNLEKIRFLEKVARERAGEQVVENINMRPPCHEPDTTPISDDDDHDFICSFEEDFLDAGFDEINEDCIEENVIPAGMEVENQQVGQTSELQSDVASLMFMGIMESLFVNLFLKKYQKFTADNIDIYEKLVKDLLKHVADWKSAQLQRKKQNNPNWNKSFLAHQTYRNTWITICSFFSFLSINAQRSVHRGRRFDLHSHACQ